MPEIKLVRFWHPRKGGWYHARLVKLGRKWATLASYFPDPQHRHFRVPVDNVKEALWDAREVVR